MPLPEVQELKLQDETTINFNAEIEIPSKLGKARGLYQTYIVDDYKFYILIGVALILNIFMYQDLTAGMWYGFLFSSYSAIANDSIQTLGTFICSNSGKFPWYIQYAYLVTVFAVTTIYGWATYDGDISYQRLTSDGFKTDPTEFNYLQVGAPIILLILTRLRIPCSTTFMILTAFVTKSKTLNSAILKSLQGYAISFGLAVFFYAVLAKTIAEYCEKNRNNFPRFWPVLQWVTTGILWSVWLQQDMSNLAVFLPRKIPLSSLILVLVIIGAGMAIMLYQGGEKIQEVVDEKSRVKDVPEATLVDFIFAVVLFVFKLWSKIPMSTTWCFIGLLAGRELTIALRGVGNKTVKQALWMSIKDFCKVLFGFIVSLIIGIFANEHVYEGFKKTFE